MTERVHHRVMDGLLGMQARLRGEEPAPPEPRTVEELRLPPPPQTPPDDIPRMRIEIRREGGQVSVTYGDITIIEHDEAAADPERPALPSAIEARLREAGAEGLASVTHIAGRADLRELSGRLERLETELSEVLDRLDDVDQEDLVALPVEESTGDAMNDLQRMVARRLETRPRGRRGR